MDENVSARKIRVIGEGCYVSGRKIRVIREGCYLSEDIIYNILGRLPAKSLIRFTSVCNNWRNMISEFDEVVVRQLMARIIIIYSTMGRKLFFKLNDDGINSSYCFERKGIWVEKACKNFVLIRAFTRLHKLGYILFVYDAINRRYRPLPPNFKSRPSRADICSLVYDESIKACKVIVLQKNYCCIYGLTPEIEVWRTIKFPPCQETKTKSCSPVDLNGVFYWIANFESEYGCSAFIRQLDIATEKLTNIIRFPCQQPSSINCNLVKMKGSLCFLNAVSVDDLQIWVLKDSVESLWILQHRISLQSMVNRPNYLTSFLLDRFHPWLVVEGIKTTYILVTINDKSAPFWYNMETNELGQIAVKHPDLMSYSLHAFSFMDFDVLPESKDLVPKLEDLESKYEELLRIRPVLWC